MQSLAEVAREEAERRRMLDEQGIEAKVIGQETVQSDRSGALVVSTTPVPSSSKKTKESGSSRGQASVRSIRTSLQKLDRSIRQSEERLESRRARLQSARSEAPKRGRPSGRSNQSTSESRLREEIEDLELKLKQLRQDRSEIYQAGKKAGFLPGELDGKGIVP